MATKVDSALMEIKANLILAKEGLEGAEFLAAGNQNTPEVHTPLATTVAAYKSYVERAETAIRALESLLKGGYDILPVLEAPKSLIADLDEDIRKAIFARQQVKPFIEAVGGKIEEVELKP